MRTERATLLVVAILAMTGCRQARPDTSARMMLDSDVSGANVAAVHPKQAIRPAEPITDFKNLSTIMQHDIDAAQRVPSTEIVYVKPGEPVRPVERKR